MGFIINGLEQLFDNWFLAIIVGAFVIYCLKNNAYLNDNDEEKKK